MIGKWVGNVGKFWRNAILVREDGTCDVWPLDPNIRIIPENAPIIFS